MTGAVPIIIATNAFGMGIDKPDIRSVVHYDLPASLDVYSQSQAGLAGTGSPPSAPCCSNVAIVACSDSSWPGGIRPYDDFTALIQGLPCRSLSSGALRLDEIRTTAPSISAGKVRVMLAALKQDGLVREHRGARYEAAPTTVDRVHRTACRGIRRTQGSETRASWNEMVVYAQTALCRTRVLLEALGEVVEWTQCGTCDNCLGLAVRAEAVAV